MSIFTTGSSRRVGLLKDVAERHRAGDFEGGFAGVDFVVLAEMDFDRHVLHHLAGDDPFLQPFHEPFFDGGEEVAGMVPPTTELTHRKL